MRFDRKSKAINSTESTIIVILLVIAAIGAAYAVDLANVGGGGGSEKMSVCGSPDFTYGEVTNGTALCAQVQLSQLNGTSSCTAGQFAIKIGATVTCAAVAWADLTNKPQIVYNITQGTRTVTGKVTFSNSTTIGVEISGQTVDFKILSVPWPLLTSFPSGCPGGEFVTAVGSTLICASPSAGGEASTQCPADQYAYNESAGGVFLCAQVQLSQLSGTSSCPAGEFAITIGASVTCAKPTGSAYHLVDNITQGAHTVYGQITFANSTTIGIFVSGQTFYWKVLSVPWTSLTSFPTACSTHNFVTGVGTTLTCAQPAWSDLTGFPSGCSAGQFVTAVGATLTCGTPIDSITQNTHTVTGAVIFTNSTSIGIDVSGQTFYFKLLTQTCTTGQWVNGIGDTIACSTPVASIAQGSHIDTGAITFANSTTIGIFVSGQ